MTIPTTPIAQAVHHLMKAGVTGDDLLQAICDIEQAQVDAARPKQPEKSSNALRQKRYRDRNKSVTKRNERNENNASPPQETVTRDDSVTFSGDQQKEIPPNPPKKNITPPDPKGSLPPQAELERTLSPERAADVIEHRKKIRKPLTGRAAKLLAGKFGQCLDPDAAADVMISNGWQGFEPAWMERQNGQNSSNSESATTQLRRKLAEQHQTMFTGGASNVEQPGGFYGSVWAEDGGCGHRDFGSSPENGTVSAPMGCQSDIRASEEFTLFSQPFGPRDPDAAVD